MGTTLSRKAKAISAQYEERHDAKTVSELKQFVAKLPQMQATKQSLALRKPYFFMAYTECAVQFTMLFLISFFK